MAPGPPEERRRVVSAVQGGCQLPEMCHGGTGLFENVRYFALSWTAAPPLGLPVVPRAAWV